MTGMVRKVLTIAAGFAVVASVASAGIPNPSSSTVDAVVVGGAEGYVLVGGFDVVVRDIASAPLNLVTVSLDFSATTIDVQNVQNAGTNVTLVCSANTISRVTNASGEVKFSPRFGGFSNTADVEVSANGVVLANVAARSTDIISDGKTDLLDLIAFAAEYIPGNSTADETDYNNDNITDLLDLIEFAVEYLNPVAGESFCP